MIPEPGTLQARSAAVEVVYMGRGLWPCIEGLDVAFVEGTEGPDAASDVLNAIFNILWSLERVYRDDQFGDDRNILWAWSSERGRAEFASATGTSN